MSVWPKNYALLALAIVWSACVWPLGVGGLALSWLSGRCRKLPLRWSEGAFDVLVLGKAGWWVRAWGARAVCLPPFIFYGQLPTSLERLLQLRDHERQHIRQSIALGPFHIPVYVLLFVRYGKRDNPLEVDARVKAGQSPT